MRIEAGQASRLAAGVFIALALVLGGWLGVRNIRGEASPLDRFESLTLDWRFLLIGPRGVPKGVVIVAIDNETIEATEGRVVSRALLARIVRALAALEPQAVVLDIAFPDAKGAGDNELADALGSTTSVVASIGVFRDTPRPSFGPQFGALAQAPHPSDILQPIQPIRDAAETGVANISTDAGGVPRYVPLIFVLQEGVAPSLALAAASAAVGAEPALGNDRVELGGRTIETDLGYHLPIRYYGPAGSVSRVSAAAVLQGAVEPKALAGQVAVVGVTATGLGDAFATPFDRVVDGVEVVATAVSNLLNGDALVRTPTTRRFDAATSVALPIAVIALAAMRRAALGYALATLLLVLWAAGVLLAFRAGYWLSAALPIAVCAPLFIGYLGVRFLIEQAAGRRSAAEKDRLAKLQSPLFVDQILRDPEFLDRPIRLDVAALFIDLSGSTGVGEQLGPELTRDLLGEMQTVVERVVASHAGVVLNYMGDGVLAAFGLPAPRDDDAARTLATVEALYASVRAWIAGLPPVARDRLDFRIGAHFGPAVVSRLGSPTHQQISLAGDTVNVASRLLEVAKEQHCRIVVSEDLVAAAGANLPKSFELASYASTTVRIRGRTGSLQVRVRS